MVHESNLLVYWMMQVVKRLLIQDLNLLLPWLNEGCEHSRLVVTLGLVDVFPNS